MKICNMYAYVEAGTVLLCILFAFMAHFHESQNQLLKQKDECTRFVIGTPNFQKCYPNYITCQNDIYCSNRVQDLLSNCNVNKPCAVNGLISGPPLYTCILHSLLEFLKCLGYECDLNQVKKTQIESCVQKSLTTNCWTQECSKDCQQQLSSISKCHIWMKANDKILTQKCFNQLQNLTNSSQVIINCVKNECL